jgi:hypothetical protein
MKSVLAPLKTAGSLSVRTEISLRDLHLVYSSGRFSVPRSVASASAQRNSSEETSILSVDEATFLNPTPRTVAVFADPMCRSTQVLPCHTSAIAIVEECVILSQVRGAVNLT